MELLTRYFQNTAGELLVDPAGFLRANWYNQPRKLEDTRALFNHMVLALRRQGWSRILINQVSMHPFSPEEQAWVAREWLPQAVREGGYRHGAVVVSTDVIVRLATAYITTQVQNLSLVYRSFDSEADAVGWLIQQPRSPQG